MRNILILSGLLLMLTGCGAQNGLSETNRVALEGNGFTVYAPEGWTYVPQLGIDSFVGQLQGDGMTLHFDYGNNVGLFKNNSEFDSADYDSSEEVIAGASATIYTPKVAGEGSTVLDIVNPPFSSTYNSFGEGVIFNMFGENLTEEQQALAVEIFRSIEFK